MKKMKHVNIFKGFLLVFMVFGTFSLLAQTAGVTVNTFASDGTPINGKFQVFKGPNYVGEYDAGTTVQLDVGDTYKLFAHYQNTSTDRNEFVVQAGGHTFNYSTTSVTFHWCGGYLDYRGSGGWKSFGKTNGVWNTRELFPNDFYGNTMKFQFGYKWNDPRTQVVEIDYEGETSIEKVVSQLQLLDHNGNPLAGGTARGGGSSPTLWFVPGSTNADGLLLDFRDGSNTNLSYEMKYNNTTAVVAQQTGCIYEFQTQLLTLRLETCNGDPLDGGVPAFGNGTATGTWFFPGGATGSSTPGESSAELFSGTYSFRMEYKATKEFKMSFNFPTDGALITWQTTKLTLNYPGSISYGGSAGTSTWFSKPAMELLPGTYTFKFIGAGTTDITIAGCDQTISGVLLKLIDSQNNGLAGGEAKYYKSGWKSAGTTDANGEIFLLIDGSSSSYSFRMKWAGFTQQKSNVDITVTNPVVFQTVLMEVQLQNSSNALMDVGEVKYYASGWKSFGTTSGGKVTKELLPGSYSFRMKYEGYTQQKSSVDITNPSNNPLIFQTLLMEVQLQNSSNALMDVGQVKYYASGWKTFGTTSGGKLKGYCLDL
jgi:hypothetical protein